MPFPDPVPAGGALNPLPLDALADQVANHTHGELYSPLEHTHEGEWAPSGHTHDGLYAPASHEHSRLVDGSGIPYLVFDQVNGRPTALFEAVNVQLVNGEGHTSLRNGLRSEQPRKLLLCKRQRRREQSGGRVRLQRQWRLGEQRRHLGRVPSLLSSSLKSPHWTGSSRNPESG